MIRHPISVYVLFFLPSSILARSSLPPIPVFLSSIPKDARQCSKAWLWAPFGKFVYRRHELRTNRLNRPIPAVVTAGRPVLIGANTGRGFEAGVDFARMSARLALTPRNEGRENRLLIPILATTGKSYG
ncbi:hypothetical protein IW262DRAFT_271755 [Armillaria fumosa]|nr:hypothetical protein IW262DRAFT_271755 [Armillaria fumosa]